MTINKIKNAVRIVAAILYLLTAIFAIVQAALPAERSEEVSKLFTVFTGLFGEETTEAEVLGKKFTFEEFEGFIRKFVGHFGLFAALGFFGAFAFGGIKNSVHATFINLSAAFLIALLTETVQLFSPGRAGLLSDVILDVQGAITCIALLAAIDEIISAIKNRPPALSSIIVILAATAFAALYLVFNDGSFSTHICFVIFIAVCGVSALTVLTTVVINKNTRVGK